MNLQTKAIFTLLCAIAIFTGCKDSQIDDGFVGGLTSSSTQSTLMASSTTVGVGQSISVQLAIKDQNGNLFYVPGSPPQVSFTFSSSGTSTGTFGSLQDQQNGNFTTTLTGVTAGTATAITASVNGTKLSSTVNVQVTAPSNSFTLTIPFLAGTSSSYSMSSTSSISLMASNGAQLTPTDQGDSSSNTNSTSGGFKNGTMTGVQWDPTNTILRLNTNINSSELDASWAPQWSNLIGYYPMNGDFNDYSGNSRNGSGNGGLGFGSACQVGSQCANFNGSTNYFSVANNSAFQLNGSYTISMWVYPNNWPGYGGLMTKGDGNGTGWFMWLGGTTLNFVRGSSGAPGLTVPNQKWNHIVYVMNSSLPQLSIYLNGTLVSQSSSFPTTTVTDTSALEFGRIYSNSTYCTSSNLSELAFWSTPLTTTQIQTIYARQSAKYSGQITSRVFDALSLAPWTSFASTTTLPFSKELPGSSGSESSSVYTSQTAGLMSGLVGLWHLDEASGTSGSSSVKDSSSQGNNGTPIGGTTFGTTGEFGSAVTFNGSTGYIGLSETSFPTGNSDRTVSVWFKTSATNPQSIFYYGVGTVSNQFDLYVTSNTVSVDIGGGSLTGGTLVSGAWNHFAVTLSSGSYSSYLNGVLVASGSATLNTSAANFEIGNGYWSGRTDSGGTTFNGSIDEVAIWNRALSSTEARALYRRGANRLKYQIRSCANSDCSDQQALTTTGYGWKGPDNTQLSYFSELYNTTNNVIGGTVAIGTPTLTFSNFSGTGLSVSNNRYIQYRAILESDDANTLCTYNSFSAACSPELQSVSFGPNHYDPTAQSITSTASIGSAFQTLDAHGFKETLGANSCSAGTAYALSSDGIHFYYWNGSAWSVSSGYSTASTAADIKANINTFPQSTAGTGILQIKTYLKSTGTSPCEVSSLQVTGRKY